MLLYCLKCRKNTEKKSSSCKDKKRKTNTFPKMCSDSKKSKFIKQQEASRLLSSLEIKIP